MTTINIFLKIWCWSRVRIGAKARGITSPPRWSAHGGDRWSRNKCDCVPLRNRKRLMEYIQKVFMRLFRLCLAWRNLRVLHSRLAQTSLKDESNNGETHLHLTRACVEHNAELRKTNAALCGDKHNAALFCNPNQDVIMVNLSVCWMMVDSNTSIFKSKDAVKETGEHLEAEIQTYVLI